jgi:hypothetical protein
VAVLDERRADPSPEEERGHGDRLPPAGPQVEEQEDGEREEGDRAGRVRDAGAAHRRRTSPRRARSPVTKSATLDPATSRA